MTISHETLFDKMEEELKQAREKTHLHEKQKHIYSLKVMCEVILEEADDKHLINRLMNDQPKSIQHRSPLGEQQSLEGFNQSSRLETEDGANGDSIFDF